MGEVQVPRDALWRAQTQRAVENFPISGTPIEPALIHAIGEVKAAAAWVNGELGVLDADPRPGHRDRRQRGRRRRPRRRIPHRRLPDRLRHQLQHERQRGDRVTGGSGRRRGAPQRPRQRLAVLQRHLPDGDPRRRVTGGHRRPAACDRRTGHLAGGQGDRVRRPREVRPHPPHGRHAGDARPGVLRLRRHGPVRRRAARVGPPPGPRASARRYRGRDRHQRPRRLRDQRDPGALGVDRPRRSPRPATTSRPRAPATRWSS